MYFPSTLGPGTNAKSKRPVLVGPDRCTKYYAPARFDEAAFADWCLAPSRAATPFADCATDSSVAPQRMVEVPYDLAA